MNNEIDAKLSVQRERESKRDRAVSKSETNIALNE